MGYLYNQLKKANVFSAPDYNSLSEEQQSILIDFCYDNYFLQLDRDSQWVEIVAYTYVNNELYYVCRTISCETVCIPAEPEELLKICKSEPHHVRLTVCE